MTAKGMPIRIPIANRNTVQQEIQTMCRQDDYYSINNEMMVGAYPPC